ncbi:sulfurtransferase [Corynebacterium liangguodongii]|uniref:Sulfurtransferase n=1 Tax=Corynebacterium liangguodongii TaxID=2079535 RepID=A0A2S0WG27_9CORY|nr:rhodanese-like domain-containing protein [Corynebacterium liangguodongii]AWB84719.1 sulfurtransferase [Corynebacterium liangguodongii]PWB99727.1 sulfurtransferase [Corynebacterium liangguodongii]
MAVFVSADELNERIQTGKKHTILAALWEPREGWAWSKFQSEHIPTALFCDPAVALAGMPGRPQGRNPLPQVDVIAAHVAGWGIEPGRPVYIYDTGVGVYAARAWWLLRWLGVEDVYILDGGFPAWDSRGFDTLAGPGNVAVRAPMELRPGSLPVADIEQVKACAGTLVDARDTPRFSGRHEHLDLKAGHIPGAVNLPVDDLFDPLTHEVVSVDLIRDRFAAIGVTHNADPAEVIAYSGSGNHSSLLLAAAAHAGLPVLTHFVAGWSQWSADPANPVARDV